MGVWSSGIWSNIFSLNLLDVWYGLISSDDTRKQHIKDKIRSLGKKRDREGAWGEATSSSDACGRGTIRGQAGPGISRPFTGPMSVSLSPEESPASSKTSSWLEASWLQPGTALARAFKGLLTDRPLHQHSCNFLRGLQLHQDYRSQKDFSTWAGKGLRRVSQVTSLGSQGGDGMWLGLAEDWGGGCHSIPFWGWPAEGLGKGWGGVCIQRVMSKDRRGDGGKCSVKGS